MKFHLSEMALRYSTDKGQMHFVLNACGQTDGLIPTL